MKNILLLLFLIGSFTKSFGQTNKFGISVAVNNGGIITTALDGGANVDLKTGIAIGLQYERKFSKNLHFQTAINWYKNTIEVTPSFYPGNDMSTKKYDIALVDVPLFLRVDLSKHFFINGGLLTDIDISKEKYLSNQSGIGAGIGIGTEFLQSSKVSIRLNPYLNFHSLLLFQKDNYPERIVDAGIQLCFLIN